MAEKQTKELPPGKAEEAGKGKGGKASEGKGKDSKAKTKDGPGRLGGLGGPLLEIGGMGLSVAMIVAIALMIANSMAGPPMPTQVNMAIGSEADSAADIAKKYVELLKDYDVTLELRPTYSSLESIQKLESKDIKDLNTSLALVWGGAASSAQETKVRGIASLYLEPLWVFHRGEVPLTSLKELQGKRVAIGAEGTECNTIVKELFADNGLMYSAPTIGSESPAGPPTTVVPLEAGEALTAIRNGDLDAVVLLRAPDDPLISVMLKEPGLNVMDFTQRAALERRYRFLQGVTLPRGTIDLASDLPPRELQLVAPAVALVARPDLSPALVNLLLKVARQIHGRGDLVSPVGAFPSPAHLDFPLIDASEAYFRDGPPMLYRYLPFKSAVELEANKALILTLLVLIWPLLYALPLLYRWRIRNRMYRWYKFLRSIDTSLMGEVDAKTLQKEVQALETIEKELMRLWIPLAYMEEFYNLRMHISFIQRRIEQKQAGGGERR